MKEGMVHYNMQRPMRYEWIKVRDSRNNMIFRIGLIVKFANFSFFGCFVTMKNSLLSLL